MKGFVLIEILLALLVISLGLLGIVGMQLSALANAEAAYQQSVAATQLVSMAERLRANADPVARATELQLWNADNASLLPKGQGDYTCHNGACKINLQWEFKGRSALSLIMPSR